MPDICWSIRALTCRRSMATERGCSDGARSATAISFPSGGPFASHLRQRLANLPELTTLAGLRTLHLMATQYSKRPSEIVGITDVLEAFCIDRACLYAGLNQPEKPKELMGF